MYLQSTITDKSRMQGDNMFTPKWAPSVLEKAACMEVWCSSFSDSGPDFNRFILLDDDKNEIASKILGGY